MTLDQLSALVSIAESGSVQGAAKVLGISRATVDTLIKELEASLGLQLLTRTPLGTSLTVPGENLLPRARRLLADATGLVQGFRAEALGSHKVVNFQLASAIPQIAHVTAIVTMTDLYPELRFNVSLMEGPEVPLSDKVHLRLQLGGAPISGAFRTFVVARIPVRLLATVEYLAEKGWPTNVKDLMSHRLLLWSFNGDDDNSLPLLEGGALEVAPYLRSHDASLVHALVYRGAGIGLLPVPAVPVPGFEEPLQEILPECVGAIAVLRAIVPERLAELEVTRQVVDTTKDLSRLYNAGELVWELEG